MYISENEFDLIDSNLGAELRYQKIRNPGVLEDGPEKTILLPNGEVIIEQAKIFVERAPRPGEVVVPAQVEKEYLVVFFFEGIEYEARITVVYALP